MPDATDTSKLTGDAIEILQAEGLEPTIAKIRNAEYTGRMDPPPRNSIGMRVFEEKHLDQLRQYLKNPPRRGRPPRRSVLTD